MNRVTTCLLGFAILVLVNCSARADTADEQNTAQGGPATAFVLGRIVADPGEPFDMSNSPRYTVTSIPFSDIPRKFPPETRGIIDWPKNYAPPKPCPYGADEKERIVANGIYFAPSGEGRGVRCIGKLVVDKCLNPLSGIWDGKKDGAIHRIAGKVRMFDYEFQPDKSSALSFKVTKNGYAYVEGKGTVQDLLTGETFTLPR